MIGEHQPARVETLARRFYRALLRLYPADFRREYGEQMVVVFATQMRAADREGGVLRVWCRTLSDLMLTAIDERIRAMKKSPTLPCVAGAALLLVPVAFLATQFSIHELQIAGFPDLFGVFYTDSSPRAVGYLMDALIFLGPLAAFGLTAIPFFRTSVRMRPEPGVVAAISLTPSSLITAAIMGIGLVLAGVFTFYIAAENWRCIIGLAAHC